MAIIKNALTYGFGFNVQSANPIDSRMRVPYKADLTSAWGPEVPVYAGMMVVVNEEDKPYVLKTIGFTDKGAPIAADPTQIENWVEFSSGNSEAGATSYDKFTVDEEGNIQEAVLVGQVIYITSGDETYGPGAYIVNKAGSVLSLSTAKVGDEALETVVAGLETKVDSLDDEVDGINQTITGMTVESKETASSYLKGIKQTNGKIEASYGVLPQYSLVKLEGVTDYAASYQLALDGKPLTDVTINIPKDMVVSSGEVVQDPEGQAPGLYIALTLANATQSVIYVPVNKLVDDYTSSAFITIGETGEVVLEYKKLVETLTVNGVAAAIDEEANTANFEVAGTDVALGVDVTFDGKAVAEDESNLVYGADEKMADVVSKLYKSLASVMYYDGDDEEVTE